MKLSELRGNIPEQLYSIISSKYKELRPSQEKAIKKGLLKKKNLLVCTPTASGKTLIAEIAGLKVILEEHKKVIYIVPLKALANEKYKDFKAAYNRIIRIALSIGDIDSSDSYLGSYDLIISTPEKLDSLIRHSAPWLGQVGLVVIDEIHLLNDPSRGPTLEVLITFIKHLFPKVQLLALSATIGNPEELSKWLEAELVIDNWRPVTLHKGIYFDKEIEFIKKE